MSYPTKPCPHCEGKGEVPDDSVGRLVYIARTGLQLSLRDLAGRMGITASYLHDLENGRRPWSWRLLRNAEAGMQQGQRPA